MGAPATRGGDGRETGAGWRLVAGNRGGSSFEFVVSEGVGFGGI